MNKEDINLSEQNKNSFINDYEKERADGYILRIEAYTHDDLIIKLNELVSIISLSDVSKAFVASLSTRRLELRSALGSYMCARNLPVHPYTKTIFSNVCGICGTTESVRVDKNVFNYDRHKWGGLSHLSPSYELFDLEEFIKLNKVEPTKEDYKILDNIKSTICSLSNEAKLSNLVQAIKGVFPSNNYERKILITILGYCGILETDEHIGFFKQYTRLDCRAHTPNIKSDWEYPVMWWRGKYGINKRNFEEIFKV